MRAAAPYFLNNGVQLCAACAPTWGEMLAFIETHPEAAWAVLGVSPPERAAFVHHARKRPDALMLGPHVLARARDSARREIFEAIRDHGPMSAQDLARRIPALGLGVVAGALGALAGEAMIEEATRTPQGARTWRAVAPRADHREGQTA